MLALLKAIIAAGAQQVSSATLAEWLWPDADGDMAASNLKVSLHRLRKLLGHDEAVLLHDSKVSLNEHLCWLDVRGFEVATGDTSDNDHIANQNESRLQGDPLAMYKGHFLPQDDFHWVLAPRERLRSKFQRAALAIGKRHEKAKEYDVAIALYERYLEVDPAAESLQRQLVACLKNHKPA